MCTAFGARLASCFDLKALLNFGCSFAWLLWDRRCSHILFFGIGPIAHDNQAGFLQFAIEPLPFGFAVRLIRMADGINQQPQFFVRALPCGH